jgi:hypothetical protein
VRGAVTEPRVPPSGAASGTAPGASGSSAGDGIRRIERLNYGLGAVLVATAALTQPRTISLGIAVGVGLTCINFFVLRKLVTRWTRDAAAGRAGNAAFLAVPKFAGLAAAVVLALWLLPVNIVAFTIGYSIFIVSIMIDATYSALRTPDRDPDDATHAPNPDEHKHG